MIEMHDETAYLETDAPCSVVENDGIVMELNGDGSIVNYGFPAGLVELPETLDEKIERLTAELKRAKADRENEVQLQIGQSDD
ncbi:hypothetical protein Rhe02_55400 [Rhizocola hellebori]|uniref:Uncharacterized protein n=1 Tax=Rhizocola hellebori TaxID=1392758 RepID=A0A8J3QAX7_9ACTN|nr:hypothetical protein [Rhizocola hellebori]GIH07473.1 hypothetical protein Rhe02_55400 [Rhizocola hellebori]